MSSKNISGPGLFDKKTGKICSLKSIGHSIIVEDGVAKFSTTQKFINTSSSPVEMLYRFPLLSGTSPHHLEFEILDPKTGEKERIIAKVEEKKAAQEKYDDAVSKGNTAVLMEMNSDDFASLSLGNIKPNNEISVFSEICQEVALEVDQKSGNVKLNVLIPAMHNSKDEGLMMAQSGRKAIPIMNMNATIRIHLNRDVKSVGSPSHPKDVKSEKLGEHHYRVFTANKVSLEKEMNLEVSLTCPKSSKNDVEMIQGFAQKIGDDRYAAMFSMLPYFTKEFFEKDDSCVPIEHILLVDRSGSMGGERIKFAQQAVKLFVKSLDMDDYPLINVIGFGSRFQKLFDDSIPFDEYAYDLINQHATNDLWANLGGTNISDPLQEIADTPLKAGWIRIVYLFTDGAPNNSSRCTEIAKKNKDKFRIFSFGIGRGINESFLTNLSKITKGRTAFLSDESKIRQKVVEQMNHSISGQMIREFKFDFKGMGDPKTQEKMVQNVSPCNFLFNLQGSFQNFFLNGITKEKEAEMIKKDEKEDDYFEVKVDYVIGAEDTPKETIVKCRILKEEKNEKTKGFVGVFTAVKNIQRLERRKLIEKKNVQAIEEEILKNGLEFNLLTSKTSFIGVKENKDKEEIKSEMLTETIKTIPYTAPPQYQQQRLFSVRSVSKCCAPPAPMRNLMAFSSFSPAPPGRGRARGRAMPMEKKKMKRKNVKKVEMKRDKFSFIGRKEKKKEALPTSSLPSFDDCLGEVSKEEEEEEEEEEEKKMEFEKEEMIIAPPKEQLKPIQFNDKLFYDILELQKVKGNWDESIVPLMRWDIEKIKQEAQKESMDIVKFITALIINVMKTKFQNKEKEWKLLLKKSFKFIGNDENMVKKALALLSQL